MSTDQLQAQVTTLRAALYAVLYEGWRSKAGVEARASAHRVWVDTTPADVQIAALALAHQRDPSITTFDQAVVAYGTNLIQKSAPTSR